MNAIERNRDRSAARDELAGRETFLCEGPPSLQVLDIAGNIFFYKMFFPLMQKERGEAERERERGRRKGGTRCPSLSHPLFAPTVAFYYQFLLSKRQSSGRSLIRFSVPRMTRVAHYLFINRRNAMRYTDRPSLSSPPPVYRRARWTGLSAFARILREK